MSQFQTSHSGQYATASFGSTTTGTDELDRRLEELQYKAARRVVRASIAAGQTVMLKHIRQEINAADISPQLRRALRRALGRRIKRARGAAGRAGFLDSKVGFGVGAARRRVAVRSGKNRSGVGIGGPNAHWFALGTTRRRTKTGRVAGQIRQLKIIDNARRKSEDIVSGVMRRKAFDRIEAEIVKLSRRRK